MEEASTLSKWTKEKKFVRDGEAIMSKVNLAYTDWKKGSMQSSFKERCNGSKGFSLWNSKRA